MNIINIFTDGSTLNNQIKGHRYGGSGIFFGDNDPRNKKIPLRETKNNKVTNQVSELTAVLKALEIVKENLINNDTICIYTDSIYIVNSMNRWANKWELNDWKKSNGKEVSNLDLIKKIFSYKKKYLINFKHVKAHKKEPHKDSPGYNLWYGNFMADKLAVEASSSLIDI